MENYLKVRKHDLEDGIYNILSDLWKFTDVTHNDFHHIWRGAYVVIQGDEGRFYQRWNRFGRKGTSSHQSCALQYRVFGKGPLFNLEGDGLYNNDYDVLVGLSYDPQKHVFSTWFQWERSSTQTFVGKFKHMVDFMNYKWNKMNIGPLGRSMYQEDRPLMLHTVFS